MQKHTVIRFDYSGGSNPGATRLVFLTDVAMHAVAVKGYDFDREEFRNFRLDKMTNVDRVLAQVVEIDALPDRVDVRSLIDDYVDSGYLVYQDDDRFTCVLDNRVEVPSPSEGSLLLLTYSSSTGQVTVAIEGNGPADIKAYDSDGNPTWQNSLMLGSAQEVFDRLQV